MPYTTFIHTFHSSITFTLRINNSVLCTFGWKYYAWLVMMLFTKIWNEYTIAINSNMRHSPGKPETHKLRNRWKLRYWPRTGTKWNRLNESSLLISRSLNIYKKLTIWCANHSTIIDPQIDRYMFTDSI